MYRREEPVSEFKERLVSLNRVTKVVNGGKNFRFDFRLDLNFTLRFMIHHWKHSSGDLTEPEGYRPMAQANEPLGTLL